MKKKFLLEYIRMLKVTISELRSIAKGRNIGGYKNMSEKN